MSAIPIREATVADVPALAAIRARFWGTEEYWHERITGYLQRTLHPQHALPERVIYLAMIGSVPAGLVAGHLTRRFGCAGELEWIDVVPEHQRRGIASQLLRKQAEWFVSHNATRVCVDVQPDNVIARSFYTRHGAVPLNPHWMVWKDIAAVLKS
jgi:GNAT superfamily N-acetyltransferase